MLKTPDIKAMIPLVKIAFIVLVLLVPLFSQSNTEKNRSKEFGHSLKDFEKKTDQKSNQFAASDDEDVIRVETNLVITDALVIDKGGSIVVGLEKSDFEVAENDVFQKIDFFSFGKNVRESKSIVLIFEAGGTPSIFNRNIKVAKELVARLGSTDRMAIVSDNLKLLAAFTGNKQVLTMALERLARSSGTSRREYSTLMAVLKELFVGDEKNPIVLIQSSGDEALLLRPIWPASLTICKRGIKDMCERSFGFPDLLSVVERSRATIYGVVPEPKIAGLAYEEQKRKAAIILDGFSDEIHGRRDEGEKARFRNIWQDLTIAEAAAMQQSMIDVTRLSGGFTTFIESVDRVDELYRSLFSTMENRYLIGYYSQVQKSGSARKIKVSIKGRPEYSVVARKSFLPATAK